VPNLFCVGDVKQSIYRFRLAEPHRFLSRRELYGAPDSYGTVVDLQQNFRSRGPLRTEFVGKVHGDRDRWFCAELVVESLVAGRARAGSRELASLSPREAEVLATIAQGMTNAAIAASLHLSQRAVEKHINSIFAKLNLTGDQYNHPRVRAALMFLADEGR